MPGLSLSALGSGDDAARQRRRLPWVAVEKGHRFETDAGAASLADLFGARSSLDSAFNFDFNTSFTQDQQRPGTIDFSDTHEASRSARKASA